MTLEEVMNKQVFAVVGDTLNKAKFAYQIKEELLQSDYVTYGVGKELESLNDIEEEIDIIDLCIHPVKGLKLIQECKKSFQCIVIQPGASNDELLTYLNENHLPYIEDCLLIGLKQYPKTK